MTKNRISKALTSLFIVSVIGLQFFTSFRVYTYLPIAFPPASQLDLQRFRPPQLWPFLTYPMYREAHYEGDETDDYRAYVVFQDSTEVRVRPEDMNMGFWKFVWDFVPAVQENKRNRIQDYVSLIQARYNRRPVSLRLETHPWILVKDGLEEGSPEVLTEIRIVPDSSLD